jgi:hypothetical protein
MGVSETDIFNVQIIWCQSGSLACMTKLKLEALDLTDSIIGEFRGVYITAGFAKVLQE